MLVLGHNCVRRLARFVIADNSRFGFITPSSMIWPSSQSVIWASFLPVFHHLIWVAHCIAVFDFINPKFQIPLLLNCMAIFQCGVVAVSNNVRTLLIETFWTSFLESLLLLRQPKGIESLAYKCFFFVFFSRVRFELMVGLKFVRTSFFKSVFFCWFNSYYLLICVSVFIFAASPNSCS